MRERTGEWAIVAGLFAMFVCLTIAAVFVADWWTTPCVYPPSTACAHEAVPLWAVTGCDMFHGCPVVAWAEPGRRYAVVLTWLTGIATLLVFAHVGAFVRRKRVPWGIAVIVAILPITVICCVASFLHLPLFHRGWPTYLLGGRYVLVAAHVIAWSLMLYIGLRSRATSRVPEARAR